MSAQVTRRERLNEVMKGFKPTSGTNIGLWLDKYILDATHTDKESRALFAREVSAIDMSAEYDWFFKNWESYLREMDPACRKAKVGNRLAIGLGSEGVLETSVTLHRTYGVPYVPGSALKGLAAAFARQYCGPDWQIASDNFRVVFGDTESAGYVTFFDALYVPKSGLNAKALHFDVMTVHHRGYYEGKNQPPADWDDPNPVPFISATGEYLIALAAPEGCEAWRELAREILVSALENEGIGGKTSSGYGRMTMEAEPVDPEQQKAQALMLSIKAIPIEKLSSELGQQATALLSSQLPGKYKRQVAEYLVKRVNDAGGKQRKKFAEKPWFAEVERLLID